MTYPTPYQILLRRAVSGRRTPHGYTQTSYGDPITVPVYALAPGSDEARAAGRDPAEAVWTVYYPADGPRIEARDLLTIDGVDYHARGASRDWTRTPWGSVPWAGQVVEAIHQEG